jgi:GNAT superfamily N-acetyltransferase
MSYDPSRFTVRPAIPGDAGALAQVFRETWNASYRGLLPDAAFAEPPVECTALYWRQTLTGSDGDLRVFAAADEDDDAVGLAVAGPDRFGEEGWAEIHTLYVLPGYQRRGFGRRLMCASFRAMRDAGYRSAVVWTLAHHGSRGFYERLAGRLGAARDSVEWGYEVAQVGYTWPDLGALWTDGGPCPAARGAEPAR